MKLFDKLLNIEKRVQQSISKYFDFNNFDAIKGTDNKYVKAGNNSEVYSESYKEEVYIYGCVYLIANTIASIPLQIYKSDTKKEKIDEHPFYNLLNKPNFKDSKFDLKEHISANLELTGNSFLLLDKQVSNIPESIYSLISSKVKINKNTESKIISNINDFIKNYEYGEIKYSVDDIIHEKKYNSDNEYYGMSPIQAGALTIDSLQEMRRRNYNIFKNGMSGTESFETDSAFNEIMYKRIKADYKEKYTGTENAHTPFILFNGLKYKNIGINMRDLEYISGMRMSREEIAGCLYQVPLILLGILENASYNNIKEATKIFYNFSIVPRLVKNRELYQKLLDRWNSGYYIDFDLSNVSALKEDMTDKINNAKSLWSIGIPINQIIEKLELPFDPIDGGDTGYIPFSVMEIGSSKPSVIPPEPILPEKQTKKIELSPDQKELKWKRFVSETEQIEKEYKNKLTDYFSEQEKEVINNLNQYKSFEYQKVETVPELNNIYTILSDKKAINIDKVIFDIDETNKKLVKISSPIHKQALKTQAETEFDLLNIGINFNMEDPRVVKFLKEYDIHKAKEVNDTIKNRIKDSLIAGIKEGESIPELQKRIKEIYSGYKNIKGYEIERIARTEVIGASNQGALESYTQANRKTKSWLTASERVRATHEQAGIDYAEGIPIDENFKVGADSMAAPGQGKLPEEIINCRCTIFSQE